MRKIILSFAIALICFISVSAQWTDDPLTNSIVNNLSGSQAVPHIAYDETGNFYIGFYSNKTGNYNIRLQYYTFDGVAQWDASGLLVSDHSQYSWITDWDLTTDNNGNCVMAFNDARNGNADVFAYAISPSGEFLWGDDGIQLSNDPNNEFVPSISVTSDNNTIVVWQQPTDTYRVVAMQKITPEGELSWGASGKTLHSSEYSYGMPRVLGVEGDNYLMAFYKEIGNFPSFTRSIYVQKFDGSGTPVWFENVLASNSNGINPHNNFTIASDESNGIIIAWMDDRDSDMNIDGAVQRVLADGSINWPVNGSEVSIQNNYSHQNVQIFGVTNADEVLVGWSKKNADQNQTAIAGQKFSATGELMWTTAGKEFIPMSSNISGIAGGSVFNGDQSLFVYEKYVSGVSYSHINAFAVDKSGGFVWSPSITLMAGRTTSKVHIDISALLNEQLIVVWEEADASDIYMQNIFTDGTMGEPAISDDATLSDLTVNGETIEGFDPEVIYYEVDVEVGPEIPVVGGVTNNLFATLEITQATEIPGDAMLDVLAQNGTNSLTYNVHFNLITDIFDIEESKLTIFPNPVNEKFNVSGLMHEAEIEIVNLVGKTIFKSSIETNQQIGIGFLKGGIYFAVIRQSNGDVKTIKLIKN